jgi:integrase
MALMASQNDWLSEISGLAVESVPRRHQLLLENLVKLPVDKPPLRRLDDTIAAFLVKYDNLVTKETYEQTLVPFAEVVGSDQVLESVTPEMVDDWYLRLANKGLANATMRSRTKMVKVFWNWCVRREYVTRSPARFLVIKQYKPNTVSKAIPTEVLVAMFELAQRKPYTFLAFRDTAILALLITFGARVGAVARLTLRDIHFQKRSISLHIKGGREHVLPLPKQTGKHLAAWLEMRATCFPDPTHDYVFANIHTRPGHRHRPLAAGSISTMVRRLSQRVCGQGYGPHSIRHWRGQTLADQRIAPTIVQAILGHTNVKTTLEHYYNQDWSRVEYVLRVYELGQNLDSPADGSSFSVGNFDIPRKF